jgi:hypothetical protein
MMKGFLLFEPVLAAGSSTAINSMVPGSAV